jgi:pimeloyl-ACP methyl ester carboxylesterase
MIGDMRRKSLPFLVTVVVLLNLGGCAQKVSVKPTTDREWFKSAERSALDGDRPSERTEQFLRRSDLTAAFESRPVALLRELEKTAVAKKDREKLFAVSELCCLEAKKKSGAEEDLAIVLYLTSARLAYGYLFDPGFAPAPSRYDPRFRLACDFYNRSMARVAEYFQKKKIRFTSPVHMAMLNEIVEIRSEHGRTGWNIEEINRIIPAFDFKTRGLDTSHRTFGLGVPLIAINEKNPEETEKERFRPPMEEVYAATGVLRFESPLGGEETAEGGVCKAVVSLYDPTITSEIAIGEQTVPLETDLTTPLAFMLGRTSQPSGLLRMVKSEENEGGPGLYLLKPYQPGKIPVVFVHGLMSTPYTWIPMFSDLMGDPEIARRCQFWFFAYRTGNPIMISALRLRKALLEAREEFDPEGKDPAFNRMVLVGHSMGGLLAKTLVERSGDRLWRALFKRPFGELPLSGETRRQLKETLFFEPLTFVRRIIFIATPHRGSRVAMSALGALGASLIRLPEKLAELPRSLAGALGEGDLRVPGSFMRSMTSITGLRMDNPVILTLAELPFENGVPYHSIIGNRAAADIPGGTDGVVPYSSSHLEGAVSEKIVKSDHGVQTRPSAIREVRRILLVHLDEAMEPENAADGEADRPGRPVARDPPCLGGERFGPVISDWRRFRR